MLLPTAPAHQHRPAVTCHRSISSLMFWATGCSAFLGLMEMPSLQSLKHKSSSTPMLAKLSMLQGAQAMYEQTVQNLLSCPPFCWLCGYTPIRFVTGNTGVQKSVAPFSQVPLSLCQMSTSFHAEDTAGVTLAPSCKRVPLGLGAVPTRSLHRSACRLGGIWTILPPWIHINIQMLHLYKFLIFSCPFLKLHFHLSREAI